MKTIRTYVSIALANAVLVVSMVWLGGYFRNTVPVAVSAGSVSVQPTGSPLPENTPVPPTPRRVVRIVRKKSPATPQAAQSAGTTSSPDAAGSVAGVTAPTDTPQPTQDSRCLITIDGAAYDVTSFRSIHSGGDIFRCGSDMSQAFWSQHGQNTLSKMAKYRI